MKWSKESSNSPFLLALEKEVKQKKSNESSHPPFPSFPCESLNEEKNDKEFSHSSCSSLPF